MRLFWNITSVSLAIIPASLVLSAKFGTLPLRVSLASGAFATISLLAARIVANAHKRQALLPSFSMWSMTFLIFCVYIVLSIKKAPAVSEYLSNTASGVALVCIPYMFIVSCSALASQSESTRRRLIQSVMVSFAIVPMVMFSYEAATGMATTYFDQWLSGVRVLNTSLIASANVTALIGAAGALSSLWLLLETKKWLFSLGVAAGVFFVLIAQSQGVAATAFLAGVTMILPRLLKTRSMYFVILIWLFSAPIQFTLYTSLNGTALGDALTRVDALDKGVGTGRTIIWNAAIEEIARNPLSYIFGTGYLSAPNTTVLTAIEIVMVPRDTYDLLQRQYTLHNAALQYFFDAGLVGITLLVLCLFKATLIISERSPRLNAIILFVLLCGFNEAIGAPYTTVIFLPFLALIGLNAVAEHPSSMAQSKYSVEAAKA